LWANKKQFPELSKTSVLGDAINYVREIDLLPGNIATPSYINEEVKRMVKECNLKYECLDFQQIEELEMNAFMSVAKGSYNEPVMPIIKYNCKGAKKTILIVGKGITFDSGGISLKPSKGMEEMKYDKSGAITVMGIMRSIAEIQPKINVICIMPLCENMPSGNATRPGDVITAYNGKSIEILNTDAEGRMILADALAYGIEKYKPDYVIDMATLTGAVTVALGSYHIAIIGNDQDFVDIINESSKKSYDQVWQLPLTEEYIEIMKSKFADIKNISETGEAGTITAAAFLSYFVGKTKWVHFDIAGTAHTKGNSPVPFGPTGAGLSVVVETILNLQNKK
jgi:leucyl aminopeptidase